MLTDGRIVLASDGGQIKFFDVRDGFGLVLARQAGLRTAIITAERSRVVTLRARRLKVDWVAQFARDKEKALSRCLTHFGIPARQACYVGDDLLDLPALRRVGFPVAVAGADPEVRRRCRYVTRLPGGRGAVREVIELILKAQGRWGRILRRYAGDG